MDIAKENRQFDVNVTPEGKYSNEGKVSIKFKNSFLIQLRYNNFRYELDNWSRNLTIILQ